MPPVGPQRGPQRQGADMDPQMQSLVDRYGIDTIRSMAKTAMSGGTPSLPIESGASPMAGLPGHAGGGMRQGGGGAGRRGGFVNPNGVRGGVPGMGARENVEKLRARMAEQTAMMKLRAEQPATEQPTTQSSEAAPVQPPPAQTAPMPYEPVATPMAPAAQAAPQQVSWLALVASAASIALVVGGGAFAAAKLSGEKPHRSVRR